METALSSHEPDATAGPCSWRPNFTWLTETLAVGGSFPAERAAHLAQAHDIRAVVDLRAESCDDPALLSSVGIAFLYLPAPDHHPLPLEMIDRGVAFARAHIDRGQRVLVHCEHGIGRSALLALCLLVELGHRPLDALKLAKNRRSVVSPSPPQYHAWAEWLARRGAPVPDFQSFAAVAYSHLAASA